MIDIGEMTKVLSAPMPTILFGNSAKLAYVNNPKAACTFAQNLLFWANHGYPYITPISIHYSRYAFWRIGGDAGGAGDQAIRALETLSPRLFTFVRDPLDRFVSGFKSKLLSTEDAGFDDFRDNLTCRGNIDLSANCNKKESILQFARWVHKYRNDPYKMNTHFRPQIFNLFIGGQRGANSFEVDDIIKIEDEVAISEFASRHCPEMNVDRTIYNKSDNAQFEDLYSLALHDLVRDIYRDDYVVLGY